MSSEHEATLQAKTEFMQLWDGVESARGCRVLVMGATNRPWMVDDAVLRRFALQFEVGLPGPRERAAILTRYLTRHDLEVWVDLCVRFSFVRARAEGGVVVCVWVCMSSTDARTGLRPAGPHPPTHGALTQNP